MPCYNGITNITVQIFSSFTLTLVDTLDTLAVLGKLDEFETAIRLVLEQTSFDTNVVVSVFETNIRMLGYVWLNKDR